MARFERKVEREREKEIHKSQERGKIEMMWGMLKSEWFILLSGHGQALPD